MSKTYTANDNIDIDDLNIKIRLSTETDLTTNILTMKTIDKHLDKLILNKQLDNETRSVIDDKVFYRLKERSSLLIEDTPDYFIRIDLTDTKTTKNLQKITSHTYNITSKYELEIEYGVKNKTKQNHLDKIYGIAENILKFIQQSTFIIGNNMTNTVIEY